MQQKNEIISYLENISLLLCGLFFLSFPLVFTILTTDAFSVPKELVTVIFVTLAVIFLVIKMVMQKTVEFRKTPFTVPVFIFLIAAIVSALLSINRFDSAVAVVPLFFAVGAFFVITNIVKSESAILFSLSALVLSSSVVSILALLSYFKIYILPFSYTQIQTFSVLGSLLDQAMFLALVLPLSLSIVWPLVAHKQYGKLGVKEIGFSIGSVLTLLGLVVTLYELIMVQPPILLPYAVGFQTAMASISQESGRTLTNFLFGSGFGTFDTVFTRFKQAALNLNPQLWSLIFFRSSSFALDLLATTGVIGFGAFVVILLKGFSFRKELSKPGRNLIFVSLALAMLFSLLLPFSFVGYTLFFIVLALFSSIMSIFHKDKFSTYEERSPILPVIIAVLLFILFAGLSYGVFRFVFSDVQFKKSLLTDPSNGGQIYDLQNQAIGQFPYRDVYYRVFSNTNLSLASSILASQPKNSSPSAETQNTILTLTQQSINSARSATGVSPLTASNWVNLASIYRSLIGFGKDAETYAVLALQKAISLDPNNPQLYLDLGSIYYQLKLWDDATRQFLVATQLKPDFANAYYNLGHALEAKGDFQNALVQYKTVKSLVATDKKTTVQIDKEIAALEAKIGSGAQNTQAQTPQNNTLEQPPLEIATPSAQLPERKPPVDIPSPEETGTPTPTPTPEN